LQHDLVETCPAYLFDYSYLLVTLLALLLDTVLTLLFLDLCTLLHISGVLAIPLGLALLHVPAEGELVVIPGEIDQIPDQIDDQVMLHTPDGTLVGRIRFWIFSLKWKVYSYL